MAIIHTIEGALGDLRFHYDVREDVLYLRAAKPSAAEPVGEESDDGLIVFRDQATDQPVGVTIVNWWKRFGEGHLPDSMQELNRYIEQAAQRMAA